MVDEIANRQVAEENLPAAHHVEEMIVGQTGKPAARIVETEEPRGDEDDCRQPHDDPDADPWRHGEVHRVAAIGGVARGTLVNTTWARPRVIGVRWLTYHFWVASRAARFSPSSGASVKTIVLRRSEARMAVAPASTRSTDCALCKCRCCGAGRL